MTFARRYIISQIHLPADTFARKTFSRKRVNVFRTHNLQENVIRANIFRANVIRANVSPGKYLPGKCPLGNSLPGNCICGQMSSGQMVIILFHNFENYHGHFLLSFAFWPLAIFIPPKKWHNKKLLFEFSTVPNILDYGYIHKFQ
jgi:hypothetical protein